MGVVRIALDHGDYARIDAAMVARGYAVTVIALDGDTEHLLRLPPGSYWRDEPTDEEAMRDDALEVLRELGLDVGARVIATAGLSAWWGLVPEGWAS